MLTPNIGLQNAGMQKSVGGAGILRPNPRAKGWRAGRWHLKDETLTDVSTLGKGKLERSTNRLRKDHSHPKANTFPEGSTVNNHPLIITNHLTLWIATEVRAVPSQNQSQCHLKKMSFTRPRDPKDPWLNPAPGKGVKLWA